MLSVIIGIDNGITGGITIIEGDKTNVYKIPVINKVVNKKNKKTYDLKELVNILKPYFGKDVLFAIEVISIRPGEGGVSAMTIGAGFGKLCGIAAAYSFKIVEIRPTTWKHHFPQLESDIIVGLRQEIKTLKEQAKTIKDKDLQKENKKLVDKLGRQLKTDAKNGARELAAQLYPDLKDSFKNKNNDGVAESLLLAIYARDNYDQLVQKNPD